MSQCVKPGPHPVQAAAHWIELNIPAWGAGLTMRSVGGTASRSSSAPNATAPGAVTTATCAAPSPRHCSTRWPMTVVPAQGKRSLDSHARRGAGGQDHDSKAWRRTGGRGWGCDDRMGRFLDTGGRRAGAARQQRGTALDELGHDADGDLGNRLGVNREPDGTGQAGQLLRARQSVFEELVGHQARLAPAADHAQKREGPVDPIAQDQGVVLVTAGDDQAEHRAGGPRLAQQVRPITDPEGSAGREAGRVGPGGTVVENGDREIQLLCQGRHRLGHVAGAGDPEDARRGDGLLVEPGTGGLRDAGEGVVRTDAPTERRVAPRQRVPELGCFGGPGQDEALHAPAAEQAIVPAEVMVQDQLEGGGRLGQQRAPGAILNLGFEAAPPQGADDLAIGKEKGLGPFLLGAGPFGGGDDPQGERLTFRQGRRQ